MGYRTDIFKWQYIFLSQEQWWLWRVSEIEEGVKVTVMPILWWGMVDMEWGTAHVSKADTISGLVRAAAWLQIPEWFSVQVIIRDGDWNTAFNEGYTQSDPNDRISDS